MAMTRYTALAVMTGLSTEDTATTSSTAGRAMTFRSAGRAMTSSTEAPAATSKCTEAREKMSSTEATAATPLSEALARTSSTGGRATISWTEEWMKEADPGAGGRTGTSSIAVKVGTTTGRTSSTTWTAAARRNLGPTG